MLTIVTRFGWRKALRRSKICTNRFILGCYLLVVQLPPLLLEGWRKLCHSFVDTNGQKRNFFLQKLVCAGLCAFLSYPLVSFRCFTYSFLLIWYLPICLLTCESYLLYSIFPLCLIWRVMPGPSRLCLWSHVIRFASYSLNSLLHLPKKNNEKKKTSISIVEQHVWRFRKCSGISIFRISEGNKHWLEKSDKMLLSFSYNQKLGFGIHILAYFCSFLFALSRYSW